MQKFNKNDTHISTVWCFFQDSLWQPFAICSSSLLPIVMMVTPLSHRLLSPAWRQMLSFWTYNLNVESESDFCTSCSFLFMAWYSFFNLFKSLFYEDTSLWTAYNSRLMVYSITNIRVRWKIINGKEEEKMKFYSTILNFFFFFN